MTAPWRFKQVLAWQEPQKNNNDNNNKPTHPKQKTTHVA